ncbi:MAG: methyltransferase domain-containing protein [Treponemataceae bacterium]|nr:MAG: methyltransferase domain-containing protein [Treponemataceae bacterium]
MKTAVIIQCRLSSTRLPQKALLILAEKPLICHALDVMRNVNCDMHILATDYDSEEKLKPIAQNALWELFAGPKDDVLERFCLAVTQYNLDVIVRATGDNPFLFSDAATYSLERFMAHNASSADTQCDYFTLTGLPHGSGIEVMNGAALLKAHNTLPFDAFEHEHVGPALYNHTDIFNCIFEKAPPQWHYPHLRTTVDTVADFRRAQKAAETLREKSGKSEKPARSLPIDANIIIETFLLAKIRKPILLFPSLVKGHGTGHLRRCLRLAHNLQCDIFCGNATGNATLNESELLITAACDSGSIKKTQIVTDFSQVKQHEYALILCDHFVTDEVLVRTLRDALPKTGILAALDEGASQTDSFDYLLNIIPGLKSKKQTVNYVDANFIELPKNRIAPNAPVGTEPKIENVLVCLGGEDPAMLGKKAAIACEQCGKTVTLVTAQNPVPNLKERLCQYDAVITHYGFTAYEARAAGCYVILLSTTKLHQKLGEQHGFFVLRKNKIKKAELSKAFDRCKKYKSVFFAAEKNTLDLADFVTHISLGEHYYCPSCGNKEPKNENAKVIFREKDATFKKCKNCGTVFLSWRESPQDERYAKSYFFDEYKAQYGKTYLEDFEHIKSEGLRRAKIIAKIVQKQPRKSAIAKSVVAKNMIKKTVFDIGCAFGSFLQAANESGFSCFGTDISAEAVEYVQNKLKFNAVCGNFEKTGFDAKSAQSFGCTAFDAVTMWFVIEHFQNLHAVLTHVGAITKAGGVFAFSTPSGHGVSARCNTQDFFRNSPRDHFSILSPAAVKKMLPHYGFFVKKIVSTGHHPERFPVMRHIKKDSFLWTVVFNLLAVCSKLFALGDTFEVYAVKRN